MKKLVALFLAVIMVVSLAACSVDLTKGKDEKDQEENGTGEVDMSKFPADLEDWSDEDMNNYFIAKGIYENQDWVYVQPKDMWVDTPVAGASGYQATDNSMTAVITVLRITDEGAEEMIKEITESDPHTSTILNGLALDAMVGPFAFCYSFSLSEDVKTAMKEGITDLAEAMNVTPAFCEE